ncbi:antitermination protein [Enterobacter sp. WCHEn045836]|uniref:bacteriophage antitermination protein Q n=1 Tax=Enterobacter sp. WCHEn045836 TaxID=2497434 RepID=UPI000F84AC0E|nr:bacteriophage antitermination protein Q [Enterobacter sp. WCHEn045836]RTQ01278.1 antitermination protein [Enterobacter sp. WCHEn045836]
MNAQQLEYVRIQLRAALVDDSGGTKGQLEAFAEHPPADKDLNPRKQLHVVELDNGRGGVRCVKAENSALYVLETRSRRRPMPPIRDKAFSSCAWRRAVLKLDDGPQSWVRYCYGFDLDFKHQTAICQYVWEKYSKSLKGIKLQARVKKRIISLVWLAAQDAAAKNSNDTYKEYAGSALGRLVGATQQAWSKTYAPHWEGLKHAFQLLDEYSIYAVVVNFSAAREEAVI